MEQKIAIVTGGTKGIGLATSEVLAAHGFLVCSCARHPVSFSDPNIQFYSLDISSPESVDLLVDSVMNKFGKIDVLVNNAGIISDALTKNMTMDDFQKVVLVNLTGTFNVGRRVSLVMEKQGFGSIVNVSSVVGEFGNIGQANYSASKAGIIGLTKTWAKEFSRKGGAIRVNAVAPGFVDTEMLANVPPDVLEKIKAKIALKRIASPREIASVILFLCGDDSSYITGSVIDVNGGLTL